MNHHQAFAPVPGHSRTSIDKAGKRLREFWGADRPANNLDVEAFRAMIVFRETFQTPLNKTVNGLRSMVRSEYPELKGLGTQTPVVQRLKRREQIISKLVRLPDTQLSNMGDIGGCRAILQTRAQVDGVVQRMRKNWQLHGKVRDARDNPAASGYRAVHVIVIRDGRRIEIQLRTPREHEWALAVERTGSRLGLPLKEGLGPADLKEYFRLASSGMYCDEVGIDPGDEFRAEFQAARSAAQRYFERR